MAFNWGAINPWTIGSVLTEVGKEGASRVWGGNSYDIRNPFLTGYSSTPNTSAVLGNKPKPNNGFDIEQWSRQLSNQPTANSPDQSQVSGTSQTGGTRQTGGSGSSGGPTVDATSVWEAQDALNQANNYLGMLDPQRQQFIRNLSNQYAQYRNQLAGQRSDYENDYRRSQTTANQNRVSANNQIDAKTRQRASSLQRLMGQYGAGDSEAALRMAPYAAARTGSQLRNQVNQQYGQTMQGLDESWNKYNRDYNNSLGNLEAEESNTRNSKLAEFLQREIDLNEQKQRAESALAYAQGGNAAEARRIRETALPRMYQLLQQITALGEQKFNPTQQNISYNSKPVEQFTVADPGDIQGVDPVQADSVNPYYQLLLKQREDEFNRFGY